MFGLVPRAVWSRVVATDDRGRVELAHNSILLEREEAGRTSRVVIEVGTGDKLDAKSRDLFGLDGRTIVDALGEAGVSPEQVDDVVVTHLHFDHAGGLTRRTVEGGGAVLTFPNATIHAQEREWDDALANRSVMTRTYFRDHLDPIAERLRRLDSPRPFPPGYTPDRNEMPRLALEERTTEVVPGVHVFLVPGHTWGQQAVMFTGLGGEKVVFTPDVMPTAWHVGAAYSLAYDVEPYTSMISRHWLLSEACRRGWMLVLDHEPGDPRRRVEEDGRGWFNLVAQEGAAGL